MTAQSVLEEKMERAVAAEEIRTLMAKYCHGIDKKDEALFMSIWAEGASYLLPRGNASSIAEIRQLVHKVWTQVPKCHHHITNPIIEVSGDKAKARTDVIYYRQTDDGVIVLLSGSYDFAFVKAGDDWKTSYLKFTSFDTISPVFKENIKG